MLGRIKTTELGSKLKAVASIILISSVVMAGALVTAPVGHFERKLVNDLNRVTPYTFSTEGGGEVPSPRDEG